jgi:hypothetical protein
MRDRIHSPLSKPTQAPASPPPAASNIELLHRPDSHRAHPPIDSSVTLPKQVRDAAERAEDLVLGRPPRHPPTNAQMDEALAWLEASVDRFNPVSMIVLEVFREGKRSIEADRRTRPENVE